jgi:hypothetical protein
VDASGKIGAFLAERFIDLRPLDLGGRCASA